MERAEAVMDKKEIKVSKSTMRGKTVKARSVGFYLLAIRYPKKKMLIFDCRQTGMR